ncbi:helix-turn-helix transcriptional regulator [Burkholderia pyrrocinia]|uniref:helix-turn-helix transcriptional regulator n=1 Tax=Burkholderia pyrrocinia TaxID=60550 RepID=UPI0030D62E79
MDAVPDSLASARATRKSYRQSEGSAARLRVLAAVAVALATGEERNKALGEALRCALELLSFEDGLVIGLEGRTPVVRASHGKVLPEGARPIDNGVMRVISQAHGQPMVREHGLGRLGIDRATEPGTDVLIPLRFGGANAGVLALISRRVATAPSTEDLGALQVVGVMLGAALQALVRVVPPAGAREQLDILTPRELQVFALLPRGLTNAAMAEELGIAPGTVKTHVERILQKLALQDRIQAAVRAAECGYGT